MCHFVSWIKYDGASYFLTNNDFLNGPGRELLTDGYFEDIAGHGAILKVYPELMHKKSAIHNECESFNSPNNFPKEIVQAIKSGKLSLAGKPVDVLTSAAKKEYAKLERQINTEFSKKCSQSYDYKEMTLIQARDSKRSDKMASAIECSFSLLEDSLSRERELKLSSAFSKIIKKKENRVPAWK